MEQIDADSPETSWASWRTAKGFCYVVVFGIYPRMHQVPKKDTCFMKSSRAALTLSAFTRQSPPAVARSLFLCARQPSRCMFDIFTYSAQIRGRLCPQYLSKGDIEVFFCLFQRNELLLDWHDDRLSENDPKVKPKAGILLFWRDICSFQVVWMKNKYNVTLRWFFLAMFLWIWHRSG